MCKKNYRVQLWRVIFTYIIAFYHLNSIFDVKTYWYIAVEFFFMLSGFLLIQKFESDSASCNGEALPAGSAWNYTKHKLLKFYPHYIFSFIVALVVINAIAGKNIKEYGYAFFSHLSEVFFVQTVGLNHPPSYFFNGSTWYISALLILGYLIYFLLSKYKDTYVRLVVPFSIMLIYAYFFRTYSNVQEHRLTEGFFLNNAWLRGFAALNVGILCYYICKRLRTFFIYKRFRIVFNIISTLGFICVIFISSKSHHDFLNIFILAVSLVLAFCDDGQSSLFKNKLIDWLSRLSYPIYLNHKIFRNIFIIFFDELDWKIYILYFAVITLYSFITYNFVGFIVKIIQKWYLSLSKGGKQSA